MPSLRPQNVPERRLLETRCFVEKREKENKEKETGEIYTVSVREDARVLFTLFEW